MKRLCIVTQNHSSASMGGAEYQIDCLLEVMASNQSDIYYLAHHVAPEFEATGYRVVRVGSSASVERFGYWLDTAPLYRALRKIAPDVIYQRVACGYTGIAAHYARRSGARLVWHVSHDSDVMPRSALMEGRNPVKRLFEKCSIQYGIRHAHRIVVQSERQANLLKENFGRKADALIRNFHPQPREAIDKSQPLSIMWVANFKPWKRPEVFIRLAQRLSDVKDARFLMVGVLDGAWGKAWQSDLSRSMRNTPNLDYLGPKSLASVNELLAQAHIFVNTSIEEGYPNTFIQAWLREVPVVSLMTNPDGILDREGIGIHAGSEEQLAQAVRMLLEDRVLRDHYGVRARQYATRSHSLCNAFRLARLIDADELGSEIPAGDRVCRPDLMSRGGGLS